LRADLNGLFYPLDIKHTAKKFAGVL